MKQLYNFFSPSIKAKRIVKIATFGLSCLLGSFQSMDAQVSAYGFTQSNGTYTPITGTVLGTATGNASATNLNSEVYPITLPFGFNFKGVSYTSINASSNGFVTFGATAPTTTNTTPISSTATYDGAISAFGRDLNSVFDVNNVTGNMSWDVVGTAPNREIVIQWKDFRPTNVTVTTSVYTFSFQIRLQETSNIIKAVYTSGSYVIGSTSYNSTAQIGLRGTAATDFINRLNATTLEFVNSTAGTANSSTQAFNTVNAIPGMPSTGLTYTWTPPSCYAPNGLVSISTTPTTANISWNASPSLPSGGYDIYYSNSNTPPISTTVPSQSVTGTTATLSPLTPSTGYYVWVRSNCGSGNTSVWTLQPISVFTQCQPPALLSSTGATVCPNQPATLSATADAGATVKWYDAATGGNMLATGNSYTTSNLPATTNYYVSASVGSTESVGVANPGVLTNSGTTTAGTTFYMEATVINTPISVQSVDVFPSAVGNASFIRVYLGTASTPAYEIPFTSTVASGGVTPQTIPLNIVLNPGVYRFKIEGAGSYYRNYVSPGGVGQAFPYGQGNFTLTGGSNVTTGYYLFYNFIVGNTCESARTTVTATVDSNCLSTSEVDKKDAIKVYPNPFSEVVNINKPELVKTIRVSDISGKLVRTINQPESVLRLNDLSSGMYILQLDMKDGSKQTIKVIKK